LAGLENIYIPHLDIIVELDDDIEILWDDGVAIRDTIESIKPCEYRQERGKFCGDKCAIGMVVGGAN
jgi:hypothetical protein